MHKKHYDVLVVGGGAAGIAAATYAARGGAKTALIDAGPNIGGELLSGLPVDGCLNQRGEKVVGGFLNDLIDECDKMGGYVGTLNDWRLIYMVCIDPEVAKLAIPRIVRRAGVDLFLYTFAEDVVVHDGHVSGVVVLNKLGRTLITAEIIIDCSGDGDVCVQAGSSYKLGSSSGEFQPVSMVFRMGNVDANKLLTWVRDNPEETALGESPFLCDGRDPAGCAQGLYDQGQPLVFIHPLGPTLGEAIKTGRMYPTALVSATPISAQRREVMINSTRVANLDATNPEAMSRAFNELIDQVWMGVNFLKDSVPGFENAYYSAVAPRIGIRETRRIVGDYWLSTDEAKNADKQNDGVAKGTHHVDIHGSGNDQLRVAVADGGSYDIPYGCLIPQNLENVLMAGRCFSSSREANGSARVMGTCMATGHAAGTAAALSLQSNNPGKVRELPIQDLQRRLKEQGAIIDGTY